MSLDVQTDAPDVEETVLDSEPADLAEPAKAQSRVSGGDASLQHRAEPVASGERYFAVDVVRGFALLGILAMNIVHFGWPGVVYGNPLRGAGFEGLDAGFWFFNHLFFEAKMMTIFSMLFGAGLILMDQRAEARGVKVGGVYYRRILWLLAIGLVHSYFIWDGDILVLYAETGLFLYFFRNLWPSVLIILGILAMLVLVPLTMAFSGTVDYMKAVTARVETQTKAGEKTTFPDRTVHGIWTKYLRDEMIPTEEKKAKDWDEEMTAHRGGYWRVVKHRAATLWVGQTIGFLLGGGFFAASRMLVGMGLMKLGVFSAGRSRAFYWWMVGLGYGIGLPLMIFDARKLVVNKFSFDYLMHGGIFYNLFGSLIVALGHVGLLMLIVKSGALGWFTKRLAAVGRMALSNYLFDSILCTTLFYGYGFNQFGQINRTGLAMIVVSIWTFQLLISPIWLEYFRFGPAEWLWRSLTYWRLQPMRQKREADMAIAA